MSTPLAVPGATTLAPVGMLAGGGQLPLEIAHSIIARGGRVHAVLIEGEADQDWTGIAHTTVNWGAIGGMISALKGAGCRDLVIIGRVRRPDPFKIRPDLGFFLALPRVLALITAGGDDSLLRRCLRFFEDHGLTVRGPGEVAPDLVAGAGPLGRVEAPASARQDMALGLSVVEALGAFDIGQVAVTANGRLIAIEGAEGTDGLIDRLPVAARGGVLVKRPKPGQELRIDMPVIGPQTVTRAAEKGLAGIGVAAGNVLVAEKPEVIRRADASGVFVTGVAAAGAGTSAHAGEASHRRGAWSTTPQSLVAIGVSQPTRKETVDAALGAAVVEAVSAFATGASTLVSRRHVLAVGIDEEVAAFTTRVRGLRQWGDNGRWRRRGVLAWSETGQITVAALEAVAAARFAGLALPSRPADPIALIEAADRLGLFLLVPGPEAGR